MVEHSVPASELREKFSQFLDQIDHRRVVITRHGQPRAYLISVRELQALEETVAILQDAQLMEGIKKSLGDVRKGRVLTAEDAFARLDAELASDEEA